MGRRARDPRLGRSLFSWGSYVAIFLMVAAAATSCAMLLMVGQNVRVDAGFAMRALRAGGNVLFASALFTLAYGIWHRATVQKPVESILEFCARVRGGDFSARVERQRVHPLKNELDIIADDLDSMAAELASVETLRTDFVSSVSHEMKTPLTQISNYATLLQNPDLSEEERMELAQGTARSARRLSDLITNVLKLNKLENQQIFPEPSEFNLAEQLRDCVLGFEQVWDEKGIDIQVDVPDELAVRSDEELLSLVWNNLLSNAFKFTEAGGEVRISASEEDGAVTVLVQDSGCGIAPEAQAHVFDRFYQADTSHATQGNGLGLALVKRVCDVLGATVALESALGEGSTFTVTVPAR